MIFPDSIIGLETLALRSNKIKEIKGLRKFVSLKSLDLGYNQIKEIKGLDTPINLKRLSLDGNKIKEIKGLKTLENLESISLKYNPLVFIEGFGESGQKYVEFCIQGKKQKKYKPDEIGKCLNCDRHFPKSKISKLSCCGLYCNRYTYVCPDCIGDEEYTCDACYEKYDAMSR